MNSIKSQSVQEIAPPDPSTALLFVNRLLLPTRKVDSKSNKTAPPLPFVEVLLTIDVFDISMLQRLADIAPPPLVAVDDCTVEPIPKCTPLEGQMYLVVPT